MVSSIPQATTKINGFQDWNLASLKNFAQKMVNRQWKTKLKALSLPESGHHELDNKTCSVVILQMVPMVSWVQAICRWSNTFIFFFFWLNTF